MRVAIYTRYSSDLQNPRSVEDQEREAREHCARRGWTVVGVYSDPEISGTTIALRPGVRQLLAHAVRGQFDIVLVEALDRLSRNLGDTAKLREELLDAGAALHTISGEVSLMHVAFDGARNEMFIEDLKVKIRRGQRGNIVQGRSAGGLTYGYDKVPEFDAKGEPIRGKRRINPAQAEVVRRICREYVAGMTPLAIARGLNRDGIPAPRGGAWRAATISGDRKRRHGILHNELYRGILIFGRTSKVRQKATGKQTFRLHAEDSWKRVEVPELRIIDEATWAKIQAIKRANGGGAASPGRRRRAPHILSDLIHCGVCGARYVSRSAERLTCGGFFYAERCTNNRRVRRAVLEADVLAKIQALLADAGNVTRWSKRYHDQVQAQDGQRRAQHRAAIKECGDVKAKIARLMTAIAEGNGATPAAALKMVADLEARQAELETKIASLADDGVVKLQPNAHQLYAQRCAELIETLKSGTEAEQARARTALRNLIERIEITPIEDANGRPSYEWKLVGKLQKFLEMASGERSGNNPTEGWGYKLVRVEGEDQIPPPTIELRYKA